MQGESEKALEELRDIAGIGEMEKISAAPLPPVEVNSHIHLPPNLSAFQSVRQAVEFAAAQKVGVLGVSNYYDYEVYGDFSRLAAERGIFPLYGLEIICLLHDLQKNGIKLNDPGNPGKLYICGKGITRFAKMTPAAQAILGTICKNDSTRIAEVVKKLADVFAKGGVNTGLTESAVIDRVVARHDCPRNRVYLQERHVCQAFQERFFEIVPLAQWMEKLTAIFGSAPKSPLDDAVKIQNEIRSQLLKSGKSGYVPETFIAFSDAISLISELGGIACYPTLADGVVPICQFEDPVEKLISQIKDWKIGCAELIPIRNTPEVLSKYVHGIRSAGIVLTAGTEHNTLELIPIAPTCVNGQPIPMEIKSIFWEGACVVAAHQFLTLNGQAGFVPNSGEKRIAELARIGSAVIHKYRSRTTH